jgi:CarD family transcriptional regulator
LYKIGDKIAHPLHGAGVIDNIVERDVQGEKKKYYIMQIPSSGMVVMIPTDTSEVIGVRPVVEPEEADAVINSMADMEPDMTSNWNKRYRENMIKLKSGDLREVATVVKGLYRRDIEKGLSTGERKMLHSAKEILISELVISQQSSYEEAAAKLNSALA